MPRDWYCDCGFGRIDVGDYKKLNTVGVPCIATVVNMGSTIDLPFIFGGDGATFALPDVLRVTEEEG